MTRNPKMKGSFPVKSFFLQSLNNKMAASTQTQPTELKQSINQRPLKNFLANSLRKQNEFLFFKITDILQINFIIAVAQILRYLFLDVFLPRCFLINQRDLMWCSCEYLSFNDFVVCKVRYYKKKFRLMVIIKGFKQSRAK